MFVAAAVAVLREAGRLAGAGGGTTVTVSEQLGPGVRVLLPPGDPALLGTVNRALAARGIAWQFGPPAAAGEPATALGDLAGVTVGRRHALHGGDEQPVATVDGAPWIVRAGDVVLVGSRFEEAWTDLPAHAGFVPFLDALLNQVAGADAWTRDAFPGATVTLPTGGLLLAAPAGPIAVAADGQVTAPLEPGVYFALRGSDTVGALTVNPDPRETRLSAATRGALRGALGDDVRVVDDVDAHRAAFALTAARADLSALLLVLALVAVGAEFLVAARGARGDSAA
jgi:hypothetical protein